MAMRFWTIEETERARKMRAGGSSDSQIGIALCRTPDSVYSRLHAVARGTVDPRRRHDITQRPRDGVPPEVTQEAMRVEKSPMTLTMALCGDPRQGRSVLDRRLAGIPEPPTPVHRGPNSPPIVSLPSFSQVEVEKALAVLKYRYPDEDEP